MHLALYLQHLEEKLHSFSAFQEAVNAIGRVHQLFSLDPVAQSPFVQATLVVLKRILAKSKVKRSL